MGVDRGSVDYNNRGSNELAAVQGEKKPLLHLSEGDGGISERVKDGSGTGASAEGIHGIAALEDQQGEKQRAESWERRTDSFHSSSYTLVRSSGPMRGTEVTVESGTGNAAKDSCHSALEFGDGSCAQIVDRTYHFQFSFFDSRSHDGLELLETFNAKLHILANGVVEHVAGQSVTLGDGWLN